MQIKVSTVKEKIHGLIYMYGIYIYLNDKLDTLNKNKKDF